MAFVIRGGTAIVRSILNQVGKTPIQQFKKVGFSAQNKQDMEIHHKEDEFNVGRIIGNLERILLLIFVILRTTLKSNGIKLGK